MLAQLELKSRLLDPLMESLGSGRTGSAVLPSHPFPTFSRYPDGLVKYRCHMPTCYQCFVGEWVNIQAWHKQGQPSFAYYCHIVTSKKQIGTVSEVLSIRYGGGGAGLEAMLLNFMCRFNWALG